MGREECGSSHPSIRTIVPPGAGVWLGLGAFAGFGLEYHLLMPFAPVRGTDVDLLVAVGIDPSTNASAARKYQRMHSTIYHGEFKIEVKRRTVDEFPHLRHMVRWPGPRKSARNRPRSMYDFQESGRQR
jgi:hypothetical protein